MAVPPHDDDDEVLEELDLDDAALVSQQSAAHAPVPRANVDVEQPSIVLADDLHEDPPSQAPPVRRKGKRSMEPTLVIRDRRQVEDLRRLRQQHARRSQTSTTRAILVWGVLGLLAFGLGGAIALFVAKSRAPAPAAVGSEALVEPASAPTGGHSEPDAGSRFIDLDAPAE